MSDQSPLTQRDVEALRTTLDRLDRTITEFPDKMDRTYVRKDVLDPLLKLITDALATHQRELDSHSGWMTWAARIVLGAVLLAVIGAVIYSGSKGG